MGNVLKGITSGMTGGLSDLFSGNIGGAFTMGGSDILGLTGNASSAKKSENEKLYGKTGAKYLKMLNAYGAGLPQQLDWQKQYQPQYEELNLQDIGRTLNGTATTPGYLKLYEDSVVPTITRATTTANTAARTGNLNDLQNLGPDVLAAIKAANPGQTGLMDSLTREAQSGLDAGNRLTADQSRSVDNAVAGAQGARGMAYGPAAAYQNVLATSDYGDQQQQQRQQTAGAVAGLNNDFYTKQILAILGIDSKAPSAGQPLGSTGAGISSGVGPSIFSTGDSTSLFNTIFNQNAANSIAAKNNQTALIGAGIGAVGSLAGGAMSAI